MKQNVTIGLLVAILLLLLLPSRVAEVSDVFSVGGSGCNGGNCTDFDAVNTSAGYYVDDVNIVDGSGDITSDSATIGGLTYGNGVVTVLQTSAAVTLTEAQLLAGNVITFTASTTQAALTVTLPATSTWTTLLPSAGDTRNWVIENPFTAAATTTTIAAGTGVDLQENDGQNVVIDINGYAWLTCFREASTNVVCNVNESIPAD